MAAARSTVVRISPATSSTTESNIAGRIDLMSTSPLFTGLSQEAYEAFAMCARPRSFARDEAVFMQGEPVNKLALIRSGCMKITQLAPNGNEVILWMYGAGYAVGAFSEHNSLHSCSVRAMEPCTALVWERKVFDGLAMRYPQIKANANQILASRLNELEERFREVATEKVAKRIAFALLRLIKHSGKKVNGGVEVSLSREELAQMTGTTLFTVSRVLSRWGKMGFVSPGRATVVVRDAHRLEMAGEEDFGSETFVVKNVREADFLQKSPLGVFALAMVQTDSRLASGAPC